MGGIFRGPNSRRLRTDLFCDYLLEFIDANQDRPFLRITRWSLHTPCVPTRLEWNDPKRDVRDSRHFAEMVRYADKLVGRIVERLEKPAYWKKR